MAKKKPKPPAEKKIEPQAEKKPLDREQLSSYQPKNSLLESMKMVTDPTLNSLFELAKNTNSFVVTAANPLKNNVLPSISKQKNN